MKRSWRISATELDYVRDVLEGGFPGKSDVGYVGKLEALFAEKFASEFAVSFCNGTATLHAALAAAGLKAGDEVVVPPLTMASTSLAVLHQGCVPVFADIDPETFNMSPESARGKITARTKAIMPVALYGLAPDMDALMALAAEHGLAVVEDDAQCFLGKYKGRVAGSLGHMASFSFQNSKHITCGEGGMVTTSDEALAERLRRFSSLGYGLVGARPGRSKIDKRLLVDPGFKRHTEFGYNYRLSELCAAVAFAQLERLERFVELRQQSAAAFKAVMAAYPTLVPQAEPAGYENSYWCLAARLADASIAWRDFHDKFVEFGGEGFYGAWSLTYLEPYFQSLGRYEEGLCPVAEAIQPRLLQLKTNYGTSSEMAAQAEALNKTLKFFN